MTQPPEVLHLHRRLGESVESRSDRDVERNAVRARRTVRCAKRIDGAAVNGGRALVVGCGPRPSALEILEAEGFSPLGVEPVPTFVEEARLHLGRDDLIAEGSAEDLPVEDESATLVLLDNVLEHVDSVQRTLEEAYRVLIPGGIAFVKTTNKLELTNREYRFPFFQWLPSLVKESVIHSHLHFQPELADYTERPAVHWFTYADLCALGREAGFARFYSVTDLLRPHDPEVSGSWFRRAALSPVQNSLVVRSLALTQIPGSTIFMVKRAQ